MDLDLAGTAPLGAIATAIPAVTRLADVPVGHDAVLKHLTLPRTTARRLLEMGLLPGSRVRVVRRAPMGDPIELRLRNYSLSIRKEEAAQIEIESQP